MHYTFLIIHSLFSATQIEVLLGAHNVRVNETTQVSLFSADYKIHAGWDATLIRNDIAVIRLPQSVTLNSKYNLFVITDFIIDESKYMKITHEIPK